MTPGSAMPTPEMTASPTDSRSRSTASRTRSRSSSLPRFGRAALAPKSGPSRSPSLMSVPPKSMHSVATDSSLRSSELDIVTTAYRKVAAPPMMIGSGAHDAHGGRHLDPARRTRHIVTVEASEEDPSRLAPEFASVMVDHGDRDRHHLCELEVVEADYRWQWRATHRRRVQSC